MSDFSALFAWSALALGVTPAPGPARAASGLKKHIGLIRGLERAVGAIFVAVAARLAIERT